MVGWPAMWTGPGRTTLHHSRPNYGVVDHPRIVQAKTRACLNYDCATLLIPRNGGNIEPGAHFTIYGNLFHYGFPGSPLLEFLFSAAD